MNDRLLPESGAPAPWRTNQQCFNISIRSDVKCPATVGLVSGCCILRAYRQIVCETAAVIPFPQSIIGDCAAGTDSEWRRGLNQL